MNQEAWNTKRKIWHISGCLTMILVYFWWRDMIYPVHWLNFLLCLGWFLAGVCLAIDVLRLSSPSENSAFKRLPFYGSILRRHEHSGYNASTYCFVAVAILLTGFYFGILSETILISSILVMAVSDPLAALARLICFEFGQSLARFFGLLAFAVASIMLTKLVGNFFGTLNLTGIVMASLITALVEAYTAIFWDYSCRLLAKTKLRMPILISSFYPDDNLSSPLVFAFVLLFFGV